MIVVEGEKLSVEEKSAEGRVHTIDVDSVHVQVEVLEESVGEPTSVLVSVGSKVLNVTVLEFGDDKALVRLNDELVHVGFEHPHLAHLDAVRSVAQRGPIVVTAPMSGRITALKAAAGSKADEGDALVVLEAMKMENEIGAPKTGVVREVYVKPGDLVKAGDKLCLVE